MLLQQKKIDIEICNPQIIDQIKIDEIGEILKFF